MFIYATILFEGGFQSYLKICQAEKRSNKMLMLFAVELHIFLQRLLSMTFVTMIIY